MPPSVINLQPCGTKYLTYYFPVALPSLYQREHILPTPTPPPPTRVDLNCQETLSLNLIASTRRICEETQRMAVLKKYLVY